MIAEDEVMPLLRGVCPSFETRWREYTSDPLYDADLFYVHLGEFARHVVELEARGTTSEFKAVFDAIERLLLEGDIHIRRTITVGLLEGIQNVSGCIQNASGCSIDPDQFVSYLKPETARKWQLLNDAWNGDADAARRLDA